MTAERTPARMTRLGDGRNLAWHEFGRMEGAPCVFLPGSATSGAAGEAMHEAAVERGIRLICIDRPGLGASTLAPRRTLRDWASDVEELADSLHLDRFTLLGHSAGGAFALAVAAHMAGRVTQAVIAAGSPPYAESWTREGHLVPARTRFNNLLARRAPGVFGRLFSLSAPRSADAVERMVSFIARGESEDARFARRRPEAARIVMESLGDGFASGAAGPTEDVAIVSRAWGFGLDAASTSVTWWHGLNDRNVGASLGREVVARLPEATGHFVPGGHYLLYDQPLEILASLAGR